ncbi:hypothetical protein AKJ16_DCAP19345 [Drosera capensis]
MDSPPCFPPFSFQWAAVFLIWVDDGYTAIPFVGTRGQGRDVKFTINELNQMLGSCGVFTFAPASFWSHFTGIGNTISCSEIYVKRPMLHLMFYRFPSSGLLICKADDHSLFACDDGDSFLDYMQRYSPGIEFGISC